MWNRLIRALSALLNIYSFYTNPLKTILSLVMILAIPYLVYLFWGVVALLLLAAVGLYLLYRLLTRSNADSYSR